MKEYDILNEAAAYAKIHLAELPGRRVFPDTDSLNELEKFSCPLPYEPTDAGKILALLHEAGSPNTVASNGGRFFGYVFGGALPASLAASWMVSAWDQNGVFKVSSPVGAHIEKITAEWLLSLFNIAPSSAVGFVTGTTVANFCGALAARYAIYQRMGWDIKTRGMSGAPQIKIVTGEEIHASMLRALFLAGFGTENIIKVPVDEEGRIIPEKIPDVDELTFVCVQAGNVNSGAIDPVGEVCKRVKPQGAWVHVDGAFGLWATASPSKSHLTNGISMADSWAIDLHKWLNVPYDSGVIICRDAKMLQQALSVSAAYLPDATEAEPYFYTPEMSRRPRGIEAWAALYSLGRKGVADLIDRCCSHATLFALRLREAGYDILNEVVLNQVLVSFGDAELTNRIIKKIQDDGTCWCGGTVWKGKTALRISVSSWMTTVDDIEKSAAAIIEIANKEINHGIES
jgi:glutamate/tyrosine decarboxylase-like PLP-dependent enzyme